MNRLALNRPVLTLGTMPAVFLAALIAGMVVPPLVAERSVVMALSGMVAVAVAFAMPLLPALAFPILVAIAPFHGLLPGRLMGIQGLDPLVLLLFGALVGTVVRALKDHRPLVLDRRVLGPMVAVLLLGMIAIVRARLRPGSPPMGGLVPFILGYFAIPVLPVIFFFVGTNLPIRDREARWGLYSLLATVGIGSLLFGGALFSGAAPDIGARYITTRLGMLAGHGRVVALALPFAVFAFTYTSRKLLRGLILAGSVASIATLLYSFTRAAYLAAAVALVVLAVAEYRKLIWVGVVALISSPIWLPVAVWDRVFSLGTVASSDWSIVSEYTSGRVAIWGAAWNFIQEYSWVVPLGGGSGIFTQHSGEFGPMGAILLGSYDVHNFFIELLTDQGVIGLVAYAWLLVAVMGLAWGMYHSRQDKFVRGLGLACAAYIPATLCLSFFSAFNLFSVENSAFWLFVGVLAARRMGVGGEAALKESGRP